MFLSIWHTGGVTEMLLGVTVLLSGWFFFQAGKAHASGWRQDSPNFHAEGDNKIPYYKIPFFWAGIGMWVALLLVLFFVVGPDYKGVH